MSLRETSISINAKDLKEILQEIKEEERSWDEEGKYIIVNSMINHIGTTDAELRDELIYNTFYWLIIEKNHLEHELLIELLETCLNNLLFQGIGEKGTDSIFTRAFTTLLIALILYRDNKDDFLTKSMVHEVKGKLILYIKLERDLRGYVSEKGWAHSVAHAADAFDELVKNSKIDQESNLEILNSLWTKVLQADSAFVDNEEKRVLIPIIEMLERGLEQKEITTLIQKMTNELKVQQEKLDIENYRVLAFNCNKFLNSFHMQLNKNSNFMAIQKSIEKCLQKGFTLDISHRDYIRITKRDEPF